MTTLSVVNCTRLTFCCSFWKVPKVIPIKNCVLKRVTMVVLASNLICLCKIYKSQIKNNLYKKKEK